MSELGDKLKIVLADSFSFTLKTWYFHWNIEGANFAQYHEFLGNLYEEVLGSIDAIAEHIRTLDEYAPGSFKRYQELSSVQTTEIVPEAHEMIKILAVDNQKVITSIADVLKRAFIEEHKGIENFLQDRLDAHQKHQWMLRSLTK